MTLLFVCSRNQWRSPTAEKIYSGLPGLTAYSAGTEPSARIRITAKHINRADLIFVMEKKHRQRILEKFPEEAEGKEIIVLDIPDDYQFMDEELIEDLRAKVDPVIYMD